MSLTTQTRRLFAGSAMLAAAAMMPAAANAFGLGAQSGGGQEGFAFIELKDENGRSYEVKIPPEGHPGYKEAAIAVMTDYVAKHSLDLEGFDASNFIFVIRLLADNTGMTQDQFAAAIGLDDARYETLQYEAFSSRVEYAYARILSAADEQDPQFANQRLRIGDHDLADANKQMAEAAARFPDDPAFQRPPLTIEHLRDIRRNAARANVAYILDLFDRIDRGEADEKLLRHGDSNQIYQTVKLLYQDIQQPVSEEKPDHYFDMTHANDYNIEIPVYMAEELAARGVDEEAFYQRLLELHNYYDRRSDLATDELPAGAISYRVRSGDNPWDVVRDYYGLDDKGMVQLYTDAVAQASGLGEGTAANNVKPGDVLRLMVERIVAQDQTLDLDWQALDAEVAARKAAGGPAVGF